MPGMDMPPMTQTQCLSKEDCIPKGSAYQGEKCKIEDINITGNTVTWSHECESEGGKIKGTGTVTYSGNSFKGTMMMLLPHVNLNITTEMDGRRIGDCN